MDFDPAAESSRWTQGRPRRPETPPLYGYVLDVDDDLADELDVRMRLGARQVATAKVLDARQGSCDLSPWLSAVGHGPGLLVFDGLVAIHTRIADRTVTELIGPGDLLQPLSPRIDEMLERAVAFRALEATRFALLDDEFAERVLPWPQISQALFRRAERRSEDVETLRAISCQPRLDARLVLLLWHLAARWGRVERAGIHLQLPLTHRLIGQLISAERPSVTHALARLSRSGVVTGKAGDWHLHGNVEDHVEGLIDRTVQLPRPGRPVGDQIASA